MKLRRNGRVRNEPMLRPGQVRKIEGSRYILTNITYEAGYGVYQRFTLEYVHEGSWKGSQRVERKREPWGVLLRSFGRKVGGDDD